MKTVTVQEQTLEEHRKYRGEKKKRNFLFSRIVNL